MNHIDLRFGKTFKCLLVSSVILASGVSGVYALECGETIYADIKLEASLSCNEEPFVDGLVIGADDVLLDLNGFTIEGADGQIGIYSEGHSNITIMNGGITGFANGILLADGVNFEVRQLTLTNQPEISLLIGKSRKINIRDIQISVPESSQGSAIILADVDDATVKSVSVDGGGYGVLSIAYEGVSTNFKLTDSFFTDIANSGVGVRIVRNREVTVRNNRIAGNNEMYGDSDCYAGIDVVGGESQGIKLLDNVISGCGWGIFVNDEGPVTDIQIRNNDVFKNSDGIFVLGLKNSQLIRNRVHFNEFSGIGINGSSTGNMILHNVVTGNGFTDMSHDATSTPNNWAGNTCETSDEGDDVDCP